VKQHVHQSRIPDIVGQVIGKFSVRRDQIMVRWDRLQKFTGHPDALGIWAGAKPPQDILDKIYASAPGLPVKHERHASPDIEHICQRLQSGVGIGKVMQNAGGNDQVKRAIQPGHIQQAHLLKFEVAETVPIAKTVRMREAGLGKIDADDSTVRVIERDQRSLGRSATGAQDPQVLPRPALRPQLNARKSGITRQRSPLPEEFPGVLDRRRIAVRLVLLADGFGDCVFHGMILEHSETDRQIVLGCRKQSPTLARPPG
jgi:hypothetical protein